MGIIGYPIPMVRLWLSVRSTISALNFIEQAYCPRGCRGCHGTPQILADLLTLYKSGWADYAHQITTGTPGFSDLPSDLLSE